MKIWFYVLPCALLACGGKERVDLGGNGRWADTRGSGAASAAVPSDGVVTKHEVQTLYSGKEELDGFAVDEETIAVRLFYIGPEYELRVRVELCKFENCRGTHLVVDDIPVDGADSPYHIGLFIAHGEVFWLRANPGQVPGVFDSNADVLIDSAGSPVSSDGSANSGPYGNVSWHRASVMACSTSGCPAGSRVVVDEADVAGITADAEYLYWLTFENGAQVARCARAGCKDPDVMPFPGNIELGDDRSIQLVVDEGRRMLYIAGTRGIAQMQTDFSAPPSHFYRSELELAGMAMAGDYLYLAVSSLVGKILRCPVSGCAAEPEVAVTAPYWPTWPVADDRAIYWIHKTKTAAIWPGSGGNGVASDALAIAGAALKDGFGDTRVLVEDFRTYFGGAPTNVLINSHHLYWREATANPSNVPTESIRMMLR